MSESIPISAYQVPHFVVRVHMLVEDDALWHRSPRFWATRIGLAGRDLEDVLAAYSEAFE